MKLIRVQPTLVGQRWAKKGNLAVNLEQRLITQPSLHGVAPCGVHATLIDLHPLFQYGVCAATRPLPVE
jgi:hypothetical protein